MSDVLIRVTAVDYDDDGDEVVVQLAGRDEDGNRRTVLVEDTQPYFYAREQASAATPEGVTVEGEDFGYESYDGVPLKQISTATPKQAGRYADEFDETWESDIPFYRRATIDYDLSGHVRVPDSRRCSIHDIETDVEVEGDGIQPRIFVADIEVMMSGGSIRELMENADDPISHITIWDSLEDEYLVYYIDPDDDVVGEEVKSYLEGHDGAESLSEELERPIRLRPCQTEQQLFERLVEVFEARRPDLVSGWNFVDFDWEYILARIDEFDVDAHRLSDIGYINGYQTERRVDCVPAFDMMGAYCDKMSWSEWRSSALDYVSSKVLGVGKIPDIDFDWAFANNPSRLVAYNIMDVMLCVALDRIEGVHDFFYELAELSQVQVYDTFSEMRLVDGYIMSQASDDEILPPQEEKDIPENAGGLVLNPSDGVREWVGVVDLKSLYPSVIITWNISPETIHWYEDGPDDYRKESIDVPWLPDADHADGGEFSGEDIDYDVMWTDLSDEGLIPKYIKRLFPERAEKKAKRDEYEPDEEMYDVWDRKQAAVKVIMNSFYGVMSNDYWRLGKYGLGDAVTSAARYALWKGKEVAEDEGFEVYYGDTDSVMISLADPDEAKEVAIENGKALEDELNERMDECVEQSNLDAVGGEHPFLDDDLHGTDRHCLVYEFEKLYRRFFQAGKKKRYAGRIVWKEGKDVDGKIDTVGFESQRSDSTELTSEVQPEVINRILAGEGFDGVSDYIQGVIEDVEEREIDLYRVGLPVSIKQPLNEYGNTQTARACRFSNDHLDMDWHQGDDPWKYFIDETPPMTPDTDVVALPWGEDLPEGYGLDLDKTLERAMEGPLKPILDEVGWRWQEVKQGAQTGAAGSDDWASSDWSESDESSESDDDETDWGW